MNNKFRVLPCVVFGEDDEFDHNGPVISMGCISDPSLVLFFPVSEENAKTINYVMGQSFGDEDKLEPNMETLSVYHTMMESWKSSDIFLSGIILDVAYDEEIDDYTIIIRLALSDASGFLDGLVSSNFSHAIVLAAMSSNPVIISDKLLNMMMPKLQEVDDINDESFGGVFGEEQDGEAKPRQSKKNDDQLPKDPNLLKIAKKIMDGSIEESNNE